MSDPRDPHVPVDSWLLGYGPMLPLLAAGIGAWVLPFPYSLVAVDVAIKWGALILAFIAGVRRGFGFGYPGASKPAEIAVCLGYFTLALLAIALPPMPIRLAALLVGYGTAAVLERQAAIAGNAPAHFARLRPGQMTVGAIGLALALVRTLG
jgi:hypothetical protein